MAACRGVDVVFHVAAVAGIGGPWKHFYGINTLGTQHVVEGCLRARRRPAGLHQQSQRHLRRRRPGGRGRVGPVSHPAGCATTRTARRWPSSTCWRPTAGRAADLRLRPHLIWGPRDRHLIPRLLARARSGRLRRVGDGTNLIDMVYVENAAAAHLQAADALSAGSPVAGRAYFISQGEPVNCWDWIDEILALAGLPPVRQVDLAGGGLADRRGAGGHLPAAAAHAANRR